MRSHAAGAGRCIWCSSGQQLQLCIVPQSRHTALQVWVLTGDKLETAISISLSCHLFTHHTKLMIIRENDLADGGQAPSETLAIKATEANRLSAEELQQGRRWDIAAVPCCSDVASPAVASLSRSVMLPWQTALKRRLILTERSCPG